MRVLDLTELEAEAERFDAAALASPAIDRFCSSSAWALAAARALMPAGEPFVRAGAGGYLALIRREEGGVQRLEPCELAWGLACPLVGAPTAALIDGALDEIEADRAWQVLLLAGLPRGSRLAAELVPRLERAHRIGRGPSTRRNLASLDGGLDGYLARRSRDTRKTLRRAERAAAAHGIAIEVAHVDTAAAAAEVFDRIAAVEARSWKGHEGIGIDQGAMHGFYRDMIGRLALAGRQRTWFARQGERDVGFVLGARFGEVYRGLQFSFDDALRPLGLGNFLQLAQLGDVCAEGARLYDLGTGGDYKLRFAEAILETDLLFATRL